MKAGNQNYKEPRQYAKEHRDKRSRSHWYLQTHDSFWLVMFYSCLYPQVFNNMGVVSSTPKRLMFHSSFGIDTERERHRYESCQIFSLAVSLHKNYYFREPKGGKLQEEFTCRR